MADAKLFALAAIDDIARSASSEEFYEVLGSAQAATVRASAAWAREVLADSASACPDEQRNFQGEALVGLARHCIAIADGHAHDHVLDSPRSDRSHGAQLWESGSVGAELAAKALAAIATGLEDDATRILHALESLSADLDNLAPRIFGGLCRLTSRELQGSEQSRFQRALQAICVWTLIALGRATRYERFSSGILFEWASRDSAWTLLLAKGCLSTQAEDLMELHAQVAEVPSDFPAAQLAVLLAVLGLTSPAPAFLGEHCADAVTIEIRNAELCCHRAELCAALASSGFTEPLLSASIAAGPATAGVPLASFLCGLLQPELSPGLEPAWARASALAMVAVSEARKTAKELARIWSSQSRRFWQFLAEVPWSCAGHLPSSFIGDCCDLAFVLPPPGDQLERLMSGLLASQSHDPGFFCRLVPVSCQLWNSPRWFLGFRSSSWPDRS